MAKLRTRVYCQLLWRMTIFCSTFKVFKQPSFAVKKCLCSVQFCVSFLFVNVRILVAFYMQITFFRLFALYCLCIWSFVESVTLNNCVALWRINAFLFTCKQNWLQFLFVVKAIALWQQLNIKILFANSVHRSQLPHLYQWVSCYKCES